MSQQRSEAQKAASRANGAKSRGPSTPEGIERCRRAATLHGMYTPQILLANEDPAKYKRLLDSYIAEWNPLGITERRAGSAARAASDPKAPRRNGPDRFE